MTQADILNEDSSSDRDDAHEWKCPNQLKIAKYATALLQKVEANNKVDKRILKYLIYDHRLKGFD